MKKYFSLCISAFIFVFSQLDSVENSIIPLMEKYESLENLSPQKFSSNQFRELTEILSSKDEKLRLVSYNVLFNLWDSHLDETHRWQHRKYRVIELIREMHPDIMGVQELYNDQLEDLMSQIGSEYAFFTKPAKDRELNGIFYRKERFEVLDQQTLFMTEEQDLQSSETLTFLKLKDVITGKAFAVFNTHLTFSKVDKREYQAKFIADFIESQAQELPVLLTGDFNTFPARLDLEKLPFFDGDSVNRILTQGSLRDAKDLSLLGHLGPISTFTNDPEDVKPFQGLGTPGIFLDHIYATKNLTILLHATQSGKVDGEFPSDHMPLIVDFILN